MRIKSILIAVLIILGSFSQAQTFGEISYSSKHGIHGLSSDKETFIKSEYRIYKFEFSRSKIVYWEGHRRREYKVEKVVGSRFFIKDKLWQIKIIEDGKALIWIWGAETDTVFTHIIDNKLYTLKKLERKWQQAEMMLIDGSPLPGKMNLSL